jgi:Bacterial extracellular solute-binding protein
MGRHSIPGPGDTPEEQPRFRYQPPEQPGDLGHPDDAGAPPPGREWQGGHFEGGEWRGGHRSKVQKRRGVSIGVIVALVAVVVVVAGVIMWRFLGDVLSHRSNAAAARCVGGQQPVAVIADPAIADQIQQFATRFNKIASPVGDRCIAVGVKAADSDAVIDGFVGNWSNELGERPALWIPGSSVSTARLQAAAGPQTITDNRSLVSSPVVLAVRPELKNALAQQNWAALPGLQTNPSALDGLNLPGWGSLRLVMPITGASDASYLAAEAVAVASAPQGGPPTAGMSAVNALTGGQPKLANNATSTAMDALLKGGDPATAPVHAVVTTEQQLYQRSMKLANAKNTLASWLPPGPTAIADYPTALLSGNWLSEEQMTAASEFARFLHKPEQLASLAKAGFRAQGGSMPKSDVTNFAPLSEPVNIGDNSLRATLADALTAPARGTAATIMLDQSMPTQEGGKTRLANVVAAVKDRLSALPPNAAVGLWTFDGVQGRSEVPTGPLADPVAGQPRSAALAAALDKQYSSGGGAVSFTTLRMTYDDVLAHFRPGQTNSILVITAGPHTDQTLNGPGLQDYIRKTFDPARPVAVNVIDFGNDPDGATWQAVAQASGGSYQNLATSVSPDLSKAVTAFLG